MRVPSRNHRTAGCGSPGRNGKDKNYEVLFNIQKFCQIFCLGFGGLVVYKNQEKNVDRQDDSKFWVQLISILYPFS